MAELAAGPGVFETLLLQAGEAVFFDDHWLRFAAGCRWHGFDPPVSAEEMRKIAGMLADENKVRAGVLRFAAWRAGPAAAWRVEVGPPRVHMARSEFRVAPGAGLPPATPDRCFKHLNRGPWLEALRGARAAGWDEAVLSDPEGRLVEACVSNVFLVHEGRLKTPSLEAGPLPGIMRGRLLALARGLGIPADEGVYPCTDLAGASEIWLSNSLIGLRAASAIGTRELGQARPVLQRIRAGWESAYGWDPVVVTAAT
jgi:branched-subunit amino acid aminotransferase/4-amino-4-deoxychorismate lyase